MIRKRRPSGKAYLFRKLDGPDKRWNKQRLDELQAHWEGSVLFMSRRLDMTDAKFHAVRGSIDMIEKTAHLLAGTDLRGDLDRMECSVRRIENVHRVFATALSTGIRVLMSSGRAVRRELAKVDEAAKKRQWP